MEIALGCTAAATGLCALTSRGGWRHRLHHVLPAPLMAVGMGHTWVPGGLLAVSTTSAALWVLGVVLARRARASQADLWPDAVDAFAMAAALLLWGLAAAGAGQSPTALGAAASGHSHGAAGVPGAGTGTVGWPQLAVLLLASAVVGTRLRTRGRASTTGSRTRCLGSVPDTVAAALMGASIVAMSST